VIISHKDFKKYERDCFQKTGSGYLHSQGHPNPEIAGVPGKALPKNFFLKPPPERFPYSTKDILP
jgi:hypothetical protein